MLPLHGWSLPRRSSRSPENRGAAFHSCGRFRRRLIPRARGSAGDEEARDVHALGYRKLVGLISFDIDASLIYMADTPVFGACLFRCVLMTVPAARALF